MEDTTVFFAFEGRRHRQLRKNVGRGLSPGDAAYDGRASLSAEYPEIAYLSRKKVRQYKGDEPYTFWVLDLPVDGRRRRWASGFPISLLELLIPKKLRYVVAPKLEFIDGVWCHVIELQGYEKLWVDAELRCVIRRRERFSGRDKHGQPRRVITTQASNFVDAGDGIFLPRRADIDEHPGPHWGPENYDCELMRASIEVDEVSVNNVSDADLMVSLAPDAIILDPERRTAYQLPIDGLRTISDLDHLGPRHMIRNAFAATDAT